MPCGYLSVLPTIYTSRCVDVEVELIITFCDRLAYSDIIICEL